jgi:hypothetical protein
MLILIILLGLQITQVDYMAAFLHADIDKDPNWANMSEAERENIGVYLQMPRDFGDEGKVLRLRKLFYGLKQAPRNFFLHLKGKLEKIDFCKVTLIHAFSYLTKSFVFSTLTTLCSSRRTRQALLH